jgi:hypothetical protein
MASLSLRSSILVAKRDINITVNGAAKDGTPLSTCTDFNLNNCDILLAEFDEICGWLRENSMEAYAFHADASNKRTQGTAEWIFEAEQFNDWKEGKTRILWCPGGGMSFVLPMLSPALTLASLAGVGKTVMS